MSETNPTVSRRLLAEELRKLREARGITMEDVAARLEWSRFKLLRLENGHAKRPYIHDINLLCDVYGVDDPRVREALLTLARDAGKRGWWAAYDDVLKGAYVGLEAGASQIRTFQLSVIPGLLQTPEYAAALVRAAMVRDPLEIKRRVEARMARQRILERDNPPMLWAVIDEMALLRSPGDPEVHRRQLRRLIDTGPLEHVKIQILKLSEGFHPGLSGQFVILDFPGDVEKSVVHLETATDGLYLEEPEERKRYSLAWQYLCASALSTDASIAYLSTLIDNLGGSRGSVPRRMAQEQT
ncbi:helix-turn-helix domain-containing protein [Bailinhaonella thermotolerans]|uniref:XRE family transcriptional regulator n=1 Tax=Bailinhaonella thermotolerans TaxID=1070861 RepID=A0A3A4AZW6_9ACTN|nr:helix-turn-helix transcriptional regulator [Bailinhaonella thermotolerans]RJL33208.1 XRE family transcriptional regulator [Bailinhaonella thermotolerans]